MTLLWFDGWEVYESQSNPTAWQIDRVSSTYVDSIQSLAANISTSGRNGGRSLLFTYSASNRLYAVKFKTTYSTLIAGIALRHLQGLPTYNAGEGFIGIIDDATYQLKFHYVGTEIAVRNGDGTLLGTTSGAGLAPYDVVWKFIEIKATINSSTGSVIIKSNGVEVLSLTNQDTQNSANAYADGFRLVGSGYHDLDTQFDDLYICDTAGSSPCNDFLGDIRIDAVRPDGAGSYTDFTPSTGSNYENVDDNPYPDDDGTYNDGGTIGNQDSYGLPALPSPSGTTIYGVKDQITVKKTDSGAKECKVLTVQGSTDYLGDAFVLSVDYLSPSVLMEVNPDDSAAWEDADISGGEIGVEVTA